MNITARGQIVAVGVIQRGTMPSHVDEQVAVTYDDGRTILVSWEHFVTQFEVPKDDRAKLAAILNASVERAAGGVFRGRVGPQVPGCLAPLYE